MLNKRHDTQHIIALTGILLILFLGIFATGVYSGQTAGLFSLGSIFKTKYTPNSNIQSLITTTNQINYIKPDFCSTTDCNLPTYYIDKCQIINKSGYYILTKDLALNWNQKISAPAYIKKNNQLALGYTEIGCLYVNTYNSNGIYDSKIIIDGNNHKIDLNVDSIPENTQENQFVFGIVFHRSNIEIKNITINVVEQAQCTNCNSIWKPYDIKLINYCTQLSNCSELMNYTLDYAKSFEKINLNNINAKSVYLPSDIYNSQFKDNNISNIEISYIGKLENIEFKKNKGFWIKLENMNLINAYNFISVDPNSPISQNIIFNDNNLSYLDLIVTRITNLYIKNNTLKNDLIINRYYSKSNFADQNILETINITNNTFNNLNLQYHGVGGIKTGSIENNNILSSIFLQLKVDQFNIINNYSKQVEFAIHQNKKEENYNKKDIYISNNTFELLNLTKAGTLLENHYLYSDQLSYPINTSNNIIITNNHITKFNIIDEDYLDYNKIIPFKKINISNNYFEEVFVGYLTEDTKKIISFNHNTCSSFNYQTKPDSNINYSPYYCTKYPPQQ